MCVFVCVCARVCVFYVCECIVCECMCVCLYAYLCMCVCLFVCVCVCVCVFVCMCRIVVTHMRICRVVHHRVHYLRVLVSQATTTGGFPHHHCAQRICHCNCTSGNAGVWIWGGVSVGVCVWGCVSVVYVWVGVHVDVVCSCVLCVCGVCVLVYCVCAVCVCSVYDVCVYVVDQSLHGVVRHYLLFLAYLLCTSPLLPSLHSFLLPSLSIPSSFLPSLPSMIHLATAQSCQVPCNPAVCTVPCRAHLGDRAVG